jgi:hypothetical protein
MRKIIAISMFTLLFCAQAYAGCKESDLKGDWIMFQAALNDPHTGRCEVSIVGSMANGHCDLSNGASFDAHGPANVNEDCGGKIQLNFNVGPREVSSDFEVQLTKNKQAFAGRWDNSFGIVGTTNGVKRSENTR